MGVILFLVWLAYCVNLANKLTADDGDLGELVLKSFAVGVITMSLAVILSQVF